MSAFNLDTLRTPILLYFYVSTISLQRCILPLSATAGTLHVVIPCKNSRWRCLPSIISFFILSTRRRGTRKYYGSLAPTSLVLPVKWLLVWLKPRRCSRVQETLLPVHDVQAAGGEVAGGREAGGRCGGDLQRGGEEAAAHLRCGNTRHS